MSHECTCQWKIPHNDRVTDCDNEIYFLKKPQKQQFNRRLRRSFLTKEAVGGSEIQTTHSLLSQNEIN